MIKVELLTEKPIALQLQEAQHVSLSVSPLAGTVKGRDAYSPYIGEAGTWVCWNDADAQWVDTGVRAVGEKGDRGDPGSDANVTADTVCTALGYTPVEDVQINGTSINENGTANIPLSHIDELTGKASVGVCSFSPYHFQIGSDGKVEMRRYENIVFDSIVKYRALNRTLGNITLRQLDDVVKAAMCDGKGAEWTDAEKAAAQARMGIDRALIMSLIDDGSEVEY